MESPKFRHTELWNPDHVSMQAHLDRMAEDGWDLINGAVTRHPGHEKMLAFHSFYWRSSTPPQ